jgi:CBS domain-containing membrane protein
MVAFWGPSRRAGPVRLVAAGAAFDIRDGLGGVLWMRRRNIMRELEVRDIMSTELVTLEETEDLSLADTIMALARIRHLPVVRDGALVGLVTHRDLLRAQATRLQAWSDAVEPGLESPVPVADIMVREVRTVTPQTAVLDAARTIEADKLGCLPVVEGNELVGIVTEADFVSLVIEALEESRAQQDTKH